MPTIRFLSVAAAMAAGSLAAVTACSESTSPSASPGPATSLSVTQLNNTVTANAVVRFHPRDGEVTTTQAVSGKGNVHTKFSSVEEACLEFTFSDDLLDPGDELSITVDRSDAGGFINVGSEDQATRTFCWAQEFSPATIADFLDGKAKLTFMAVSGSVTIRSVTLTISGSPR